VEEVEGDNFGFEVYEPSPSSNYSKLEKTLFGLGLPGWDDGAEEIQL
jgi:hypothetical protein